MVVQVSQLLWGSAEYMNSLLGISVGTAPG